MLEKNWIVKPASLFIYLFIYFLATPRGMWDINSRTRDQTRAPWTGSVESQLLDHQGSPPALIIYINHKHLTKCKFQNMIIDKFAVC